MHKTYAYVSAAPEKKTPRSPFCLNERDQGPDRLGRPCVSNICISFRCRREKYTDDRGLSGNREPASADPVFPPANPVFRDFPPLSALFPLFAADEHDEEAIDVEKHSVVGS